MPEDFRIIGSGRHSPGSDDDFRAQHQRGARSSTAACELDEHWDAFADRLSFVASERRGRQPSWRGRSRDAEAEIGAEGERLVYLSVPPERDAGHGADARGETGIAENCSLVVEKPFGHDEASAKELNATLHDVLDEESIYRIDHFLGKEAAQNILALRFANGIFEPVWNRDHVAYVQIDVPETLDIQGRAGFYEQTGAFRDMVVTHLLQILGIVALEPPSRIDADSLHLERTKLFEAIRPLDRERVVFGQYDGYRDEEGVAADSQVETFAALEVWVDTWRWSGVPFYLRTGKSLAEGRRTVTIGFTNAPLRLFPNHTPEHCVRPSELVFELSDDPQVRSRSRPRSPGPVLDLGRAALTLDVGPGVRRRGRAGGLRAAAARRDAARAPALHPLGADRAAVGGVRAGDRGAARASSPTSRARGGRRRRWSCPPRPGWRLPDGNGVGVTGVAAASGPRRSSCCGAALRGDGERFADRASARASSRPTRLPPIARWRGRSPAT